MSHGPLATAPRALILDYGGVVVATSKRPSGITEFAAVVAATLRRAGVEVPLDRLERSVRAGIAALNDYNNVSSRRREPVELTHQEIITDFLASDLPERARLVLGADAARLCHAKVTLLSGHSVRPGVRALLTSARERGIRTGIASNAQSGTAHRAFVDASGLTDLFDVQVYSDEIGVRKPHPDVLHTVADALNVPTGACWYVGDTRDRDLLAGRRAGVGAVILIRHHSTDSPPYAVDGEPDAMFDEVTELTGALAAAGPTTDDATPAVTGGEPTGTPSAGARPRDGDPTGSPVERRGPAGTLRRPRALLLDNGGVITLSEKNPDGERAFAADLGAYLRRAGHDVGNDMQVLDDLKAGRKRYETWKQDNEDGERVPEITPVGFWDWMIPAHWPERARAAVFAQANELIYRYVRARAIRHPRLGMLDVLEYTRANDIPVGIVSNTVCGRVPRENHVSWGIEPYLAVSFFSDEFGLRKPDPSIILACASALGVDPADCWFVGDKRGRDIEAARRAGVGVTLLIESRQTMSSTGPEPDHAVRDALGLLEALLAARVAGPRAS